MGSCIATGRFDYPGQTVTVPHAINDALVIAGSVGISPVFGFTYDGTNFSAVAGCRRSNV
jgi:hypothetical protein